MGCIGDMLLHCAILYVVVDVITSIICTTYTYKVLHKFFSGRGLCDELITRPEESYRLWCVVVCDLETS
jgi:hypothetical protein